jgi:hypothetical protein
MLHFPPNIDLQINVGIVNGGAPNGSWGNSQVIVGVHEDGHTTCPKGKKDDGYTLLNHSAGKLFVTSCFEVSQNGKERQAQTNAGNTQHPFVFPPFIILFKKKSTMDEIHE